MDISAVSSKNFSTLATTMQQEQNKTESFQTIMDKAVADKNKQELKSACLQFESYFINMMYKEMKKTVHSEDGFLPKGQAENIFQDMVDEENSKSSAKAGGIGLANMMYKQLERNM